MIKDPIVCVEVHLESGEVKHMTLPELFAYLRLQGYEINER